jgi:16S rRNA (adenine1518-N6/adenine1519-N6)-dimethyltransferase
MVQKEVAEKFAAKSGERNFGSLAILAQSVADVKVLFEVDSSSFIPQPKVTSAILEIRKFKTLTERGFEKFLKVATKQPRKTLLKNLSTSYDKRHLQSIFSSLDIPTDVRPHKLELSVYHRLYNLIKDMTDEREEESRDKSKRR